MICDSYPDYTGAAILTQLDRLVSSGAFAENGHRVIGMAVVNATPEQKKAFGEALMAALEARNLRPPDLVDVVTAADRNSASNLVKNWINGKTEPSRPTVIAVEAFLDLVPGTLSRHLGWLPVGAPEVPEPEAAVIADTRFTGEQRRILLALMERFRDE